MTREQWARAYGYHLGLRTSKRNGLSSCVRAVNRPVQRLVYSAGVLQGARARV